MFDTNNLPEIIRKNGGAVTVFEALKIPGPPVRDYVHLLGWHTSSVSSVTISPCGRFVLTGSWDNTMIFWDVETGKQLVRCYNLKAGFLWTTPPDEIAPNGWFWTDRPELISVVRCNEDASNTQVLADNDPERETYIKLHNNPKIMERINNPDEWEKHIRIMIEAREKHAGKTALDNLKAMPLIGFNSGEGDGVQAEG